MNQFENIDMLESALSDLGAALEHEQVTYELYVIGGSAFLLQEPHRAQATADIDVAGQVLPDGSVVPPVPLPIALQRAAHDVARIHGLSPGWINSAAAASFDHLIPDGALERATVRRWGGLTIRIADRIDLIRLKLAAAMRRGERGERYGRDLALASATDVELDDARRWYLAHQSDRATASERVEHVVAQIRRWRDGA